MLSRHLASAGARGSRRHRSLVAISAAVSLLGVLTLASSGAFAATAAAAKKSSANPYAKYYSALSALESGAKGGSLTEQGSTLFYPLFATWASMKPLGISLTTQGTGSGAGKTAAENGTSDIGASDSYLLPTDPTTVENIPIVVSAQEVAYNVPGLPLSTHLKLNASILNGIYTGAITKWNNPQIVNLNKGNLPAGFTMPSTTIIPIHRSDSSGDTFLFTSYLYSGEAGSFVASTGPSNAATFPKVGSALAEQGNQSMLTTCQQTPGCVAYIGSSYLRGAQRTLGIAKLENGAGNYVQLSVTNVENEVNSYKKVPASGVLSLINSKAAKNGYPIVNFEYAIVNKSNSKSADLKALLAWGMDPRHGATNSLLSPYFFHPLPPVAMAVAISLLKKIA